MIRSVFLIILIAVDVLVIAGCGFKLSHAINLGEVVFWLFYWLAAIASGLQLVIEWTEGR